MSTLLPSHMHLSNLATNWIGMLAHHRGCWILHWFANDCMHSAAAGDCAQNIHESFVVSHMLNSLFCLMMVNDHFLHHLCSPIVSKDVISLTMDGERGWWDNPSPCNRTLRGQIYWAWRQLTESDRVFRGQRRSCHAWLPGLQILADSCFERLELHTLDLLAPLLQHSGTCSYCLLDWTSDTLSQNTNLQSLAKCLV